jgi:DNA-binding GntR family transcriptional regulator
LIRKNHLRREIVKLSMEEFAHIYELKNVVEAFGAMKGSLAASQRDIENIKEVLNQIEQAILRGDMTQLQYLNQSFHESLVFCCANKKLIDTFLSLVKQVRWTTSLALKLTERPPQSSQEHIEIFEAFQQRKAEEVRTLIERHTNAHMNRVLAQMESWG